MTFASHSEININVRQKPVTESIFFPMKVFAEMVDPKDVPLVVLPQQERLKKVKAKKKASIQCKLSL